MRPIWLFAITILAVLAAQGQEPKRTQAIYILPFLSAPGAAGPEVYSGIGVQTLFEHMLVTDGDLEEAWGWWEYRTLFPKAADLELYLKGQTKEPDGIAALAPRWLVRGRMLSPDRVSITVDDRQTARHATREFSIDFPGLETFRQSFLDVLQEAGVPLPDGRQSKMRWREELPPHALALLGRGSFHYQYESTEISDFTEGLKLAPRSYLLLDMQGWLDHRLKQYGDAARIFAEAVRQNPDAVDVFKGQLQIAAQQDQVTEARKAYGEVARVRGEPSDTPDAIAGLSRVFQRVKQFDAAESILQTRRDQETDAVARQKLGAALANGFVARANSMSQTDRKAAIPIYEKALALQRALPDRAAEARTLGTIGVSLHTLGQYADAIPLHEKELALRRELKDRRGEETCLEMLSSSLFRVQDYKAARDHYQEALPLARDLKNREAEARILGSVGFVYWTERQYTVAISWYEKALPVYREVKNRTGEQATLQNLGAAYHALKQDAAAIPYYEQAVTAAHELKDRGAEARSLQDLAYACRLAERYKDAIAWYGKLLPLVRELKDKKAEQIALGRLGWAYHMVKDDQAAVRSCQQGLAIVREMKDRPGEARFLADLGYILWSAHQYQEAAGWYEKALPIQQESHDRAAEVLTLHQLGLINEWLNLFRKSISWFEPELAIRRELKDRAGEARCLYSLGLCYRRIIRYEESLTALEQARTIFREMNIPAEEARTLMGTGDAYEVSRQYPKANEAYQQALTLLQQTKQRANQARLLERLGTNYREQKQGEQAIRSFQQAIEIRRELKDRIGEAHAIDSIGRVHDEAGARPKAIEFYEQELAIWRELKDSANESVTVRKIGDAYDKQGQFAKSLSYYEQSVTARQDQRISAKDRVTTAENDFELLDHVNPAVLILPFAGGKGTSEDDRLVGVALQYMIENVINEAPEVQKVFLTQNIRTGFKQLDQWNAYLRGGQDAPRYAGFACVVSGHLERQADHYALSVDIQHDDGTASGTSVPVDFPSLQEYRSSFLTELQKARCGITGTPPAAQWNEPLNVAAANALGRGRAANLGMLISGQPGDAALLDEAVRLAPQSFLATANRAYGYQHLGRNAEAAVFYDQAIQLARTYKKQMSETLMLINVCGAYSDSNEREKAILNGARALALSQQMKNPEAELFALMALGGAYAKQGQNPQAVGQFERALSIAREAQNQVMLGIAISGLANAYYALGRYESAAAYFTQGVQFAQTAKDRGAEGLNLFNVGLCYTALVQHAKAAASYGQALVIARESRDRGTEGQLLYNIGIAHANLGETETAIDDYQKALAIQRDLKNRAAERDVLVGIGLCYSTLSQFDKSLGYFEQSLAIARELKNRSAESDSLMRLGTTHGTLNQFSKAFDELERALAAAREGKNHSVEGDALTQLGALYFHVHQNDRALSYYQQALTVARDTKNRKAEANAHYALGGAYYGLGKRKEAGASYNAALAIAIEVKDRAMQGRILTPIGRIYLEAGQPDKAIGHFEQARLVARERKDLPGEAVVQINLGYANLLLKRYEASTTEFERALTISREAKLPESESQALAGLMFAWAGRRQPRLAIVVGKQGINIVQEARADLQTLDSSMSQSFAKSREPVYRFLADLLAGQGRLAEAQQVLDLLKEEELASFVERAKDVASGQGQATLTAQETEWEKRYREIAGQLTATGLRRGMLLAKPDRSAGEDGELAKLETDLEVGNRAFKAYLDSMEDAFRASKGGAEEVTKVREAEGLMETLRDLGPGTVAVYTVVGEQGLRSILITPDVQKGYFSPITTAELNKKILAFREAVRNPTRDPLPLSHELYDLLVKPMEKDLEGAQASTIMWSLDGALRYVPVAALHDGHRYMVERYRNVVFTPASQSRLKDTVSHTWRGLGLGVSLAHEGFLALPNVPNELHSIILDDTHSAPGMVPGTVKLDADFTKEILRSELRKHYTMVHLASHFDFVPGTDKNSFLLLGDGGKLTLDEFRSMPQVLQGVELLTLSACDTAVGGEGADGKEVEGFAVLAQRQGAKAVLATLWSVADESTTLLMSEFYRLRMSQGDLTKVEALRQAQVALLTGKLRGDASSSRGVRANREAGNFVADPARPYAHPYFWAPFLLMGNWK